MPRKTQNPDAAADEAFLAEIHAQCWRFGYRTQSSLGDALGISQVTAGKYLKSPADMKFATLRKLVRTLRPDPSIVLKAIGYSDTEIQKWIMGSGCNQKQTSIPTKGDT